MTTGNLKPIFLQAQGKDSVGNPEYIVGFSCDGTVSEYRFFLASNRKDVVCDPDFEKVANRTQNQASSLFRSIQLFEEATELMQVDSRSTEGILPGGKHAILKRKRMMPISIRAESPESDHLQPYKIRVVCEGAEVEYRFVVDHNGIVGVKPEPRFSKDMASNLTPAIPLFQAIIAFFEASLPASDAN